MTSPKSSKPRYLPLNVKHSHIPRGFEVDTLPLQSLQLIAAPEIQDDPADEQNVKEAKQLIHSPELIAHLIEFIKSL